MDDKKEQETNKAKNQQSDSADDSVVRNEQKAEKRDVKFEPDQEEFINTRIAEATKKANEEAKQSRLKLKEYEDAQRAEREQRLKEANEFKTLYDESKATIAELTNKIALQEARIAELEQIEKKAKDAEEKERKSLLASFSDADKLVMKDLPLEKLRYLSGRMQSSDSNDQRKTSNSDDKKTKKNNDSGDPIINLLRKATKEAEQV